MKLRLKENSLRLRLNQVQVRALAAGSILEQRLLFPGQGRFAYTLQSAAKPGASFESGTIRIKASESEVRRWAEGDEIGLYYEFPTGEAMLRVAIEKDLVCLDGPEEERDPNAYARPAGAAC